MVGHSHPGVGFLGTFSGAEVSGAEVFSGAEVSEF
jgi:hypothetical protein